jgi:integrase
MSNSNLIEKYHRLNVYDYIFEFAGWEPLTELIKYAGSPRNELYLLSLIKSGGRASECLALDKENFSVITKKKYILVQNMRLEKRWMKVKGNDGTSYRQHLEAIRKPFPILLKEPLSQELLDHLEAVKDGPIGELSPLFKSPYKSHKPLTRDWGYKLIRRINDELPRPLFNRLGLNTPFRDKVTQEQLSATIHLWQHWFRSQRASQLRSEYDFSEADLMEFFGWLDYKTALHYSKLGASNLAAKMSRA